MVDRGPRQELRARVHAGGVGLRVVDGLPSVVTRPRGVLQARARKHLRAGPRTHKVGVRLQQPLGVQKLVVRDDGVSIVCAPGMRVLRVLPIANSSWAETQSGTARKVTHVQPRAHVQRQHRCKTTPPAMLRAAAACSAASPAAAAARSDTSQG